MCRTCGVSPATATSANLLLKAICGEVEKSQIEICDFSRLKVSWPSWVCAEFLNTKPYDLKSFPSGQLAPAGTQGLQPDLLAVGIPF